MFIDAAQAAADGLRMTAAKAIVQKRGGVRKPRLEKATLTPEEPRRAPSTTMCSTVARPQSSASTSHPYHSDDGLSDALLPRILPLSPYATPTPEAESARSPVRQHGGRSRWARLSASDMPVSVYQAMWTRTVAGGGEGV